MHHDGHNGGDNGEGEHNHEAVARNMLDVKLKSKKKFLEPDGQKVTNGNVHHNHGDMSQASVRNESFKNFPKKFLLGKIIESGYFYAGEDDRTICYKCDALVFDWKEKDNPATFHEPHCEYHRKEEAKTKDAQSSFQGTSLLDIPITESSTVTPGPVLLKPSRAPTNPLRFEGKLRYGIPMIVGESQNHSSPLPQSLPVYENYGLSGSAVPPAAKRFIEKQIYWKVEIADGIEQSFKRLLENLNLCSEEDRRKTFYVDACWAINTNKVLDPRRLARNGFYYLGNLDRTQCFSCAKIFKGWLRNDVIKVVHKEVAPKCRMASGKESRNIPIPNFQSFKGSLSPLSSLHHSNLKQAMLSASTFDSKLAASSMDSNPLSLEISSSSSFSTGTAASNIQIVTSASLSGPNESPAKTAMSSLPLQSCVRQAQNTSSSLSDPNQSALKLSASLSMQPNRDSQQPVCDPHFRIPAAPGMDLLPQIPLDLSIRQSAHTSENVGSPTPPFYRETNVQVRNLPRKIQIGGLLPIPVSSPEENEGQGEPASSPTTEVLHPSSMSWHIGQTTLYNNTTGAQTTAHTITRNTPHRFPEESQEPYPALPVNDAVSTIPTMSEGEWAEIFPCNEPYERLMRSAIARQETFDYTWAARGIGITDEIARAGFYSLGEDDQVKCWYCGVGAHHWSQNEDPWKEHARIYPNCEYLLQQKGPGFVATISSERQAAEQVETPRPGRRFARSPSISSNSSASLNSLPEVPSPRTIRSYIGSPMRLFRNREVSPPRVVDPREEETRHKRMIEAHLNSEISLSAIEMGFDMKAIKKAIKVKVRETDSPFQNAEELLDALLNQSTATSESSDSDEEDPNSGPSTSNTPSMSTMHSGTGETSQTTILTGAQGEDRPKPSPLEGAENLDPRKLDERLREYEQEKRCKVCLDRDAQVVFVPCGHMCTCVECANVLRACPLCRKRIHKSMKIYTS